MRRPVSIRPHLLTFASLVLFACAATPPAVDAGEQASDGAWRASLYPEDWAPGFADDAGRFLHDFSYAGYAAGLREPPAPPESTRLEPGPGDMTALVQAALNDGGVVLLGAGDWRFDGSLLIRRSGTVLRGEGPTRTRLIFTQTIGLSYLGSISVGAGLEPSVAMPLKADALPGALTVRLNSARGFASGDDIALGLTLNGVFLAEHGMADTWTALNGSWQRFLWRRVVAVEDDALTLNAPVRNALEVRHFAKVQGMSGVLREVGVEHLAITNAVDETAARSMNQVAAIELLGVSDGWVRDVRSFSLDGGAHLQSVGIRVSASNQVTVSDTQLGRPQHRGSDGNGHLFDVRQSSDVLFRDDVGEDGRHNFISGWGFGTTGCVWLRVMSRGGFAEARPGSTSGTVSPSGFHSPLATANLIDSSRFDDGFSIVNHHQEFFQAGHTGTENAFWNVEGDGVLRSMQFGHGYVFGTQRLTVALDDRSFAEGTAPIDLAEGLDAGATLQPRSLYEDQLRRRRGR